MLYVKNIIKILLGINTLPKMLLFIGEVTHECGVVNRRLLQIDFHQTIEFLWLWFDGDGLLLLLIIVY